MKQIEFKIVDDSGNWVGNIFIDFPNKNEISINIRYGPPLDNSFNEFTFDGHYRCEIMNGLVTYEALPISTNYNKIIETLLKVLKQTNEPYVETIKIALLNKKVETERF